MLSKELWIMASCLLRPMSRNSVSDELSVRTRNCQRNVLGNKRNVFASLCVSIIETTNNVKKC